MTIHIEMAYLTVLNRDSIAPPNDGRLMTGSHLKERGLPLTGLRLTSDSRLTQATASARNSIVSYKYYKSILYFSCVYYLSIIYFSYVYYLKYHLLFLCILLEVSSTFLMYIT